MKKLFIQLSYSLLLITLILSSRGFSQTIPAFKPLRYDENYLFLQKDSSADWYKKTKYSKLSKKGDVYISFGGDVRFQYFYFKNEAWGEVPQDNDGYILTRWLGHADFHVGKYFRTFVQLQSSLANGLDRSASPVHHENSPSSPEKAPRQGSRPAPGTLSHTQVSPCPPFESRGALHS